MMKKNLLLTLILSVASNAFAVDVEIDGLWYDVVSKTKEAKVIKYRGNSYGGDVVIPETVEYEGITYSVTSIGEWAFTDCRSLTSVTIPNSVTSIEHGAFSVCTSLTSITIPNSVTSIGEYAFGSCGSLISITIGKSVTSISEF